MNLIIVESPTKAKTLSRFLGEEYLVEATRGHIKDLPKKELAVEIEKDFKPLYVIVEKKKDLIKNLKIKSEKSKAIYLATDPDREGEAIAQHVSEILTEKDKGNLGAKRGRNKPISRIVFHEITKRAVEEALKNPRDIDKNLVNAQIARRVLDRLVGYKLSPLLWKKVRRGLSAGRVQSAAVRLIVEREKEIESFVPEEYWEFFCLVKSKNSKTKSNEFSVKLFKIDNKTVEIKNKRDAQKVIDDLEKAEYKVNDVKKKEVKKFPYPPFTTSTMAQATARIFGWSAKKTMSLAQRLYEEGLITYHRTDSTHLSLEAIEKVRSYIEVKYSKKYLPDSPRFYKTSSKLAQEAHEAIRPTNVQMTSDQLPARDGLVGSHKILYDLIWKRFVACQMKESIFDETVVDVDARSKTKSKNSKAYLLRASGHVMRFDGWRKIIPLRKDEQSELPLVERGEDLELIKVSSEQKFTQPPLRYNEASLIRMLEKLGIGRPSTYAPIISTIQARSYVEKDEGRFKPTPVGIAVNDFLTKNFPDIVDYSFTAEMEDELDEIARGELRWVSMMENFYTPFVKKLVSVEKNSKRVKIEVERLGKECPNCGKGELVVRIGRFGKFLSCSRFPECNYKDKYIEKIGMKCPECGKGDVVVKYVQKGSSTGNKGKKFFGCSRYPDCKWASWRKPEKSSK